MKWRIPTGFRKQILILVKTTVDGRVFRITEWADVIHGVSYCIEKYSISKVATNPEGLPELEYLDVVRIRKKENTFTTMATNVNDKESGCILRITKREAAIRSGNGRVNKWNRGIQAWRENRLKDMDVFVSIAIGNLFVKKTRDRYGEDEMFRVKPAFLHNRHHIVIQEISVFHNAISLINEQAGKKRWRCKYNGLLWYNHSRALVPLILSIR